jgi:predicted HTH domain antitoxin
MSVQLTIPDDIVEKPDSDVSREVIEAVAIDGFRTGQLSTAQVRRLLGFETRAAVHRFLADHGVPWVDYPPEDADSESELLKEVLP